MRKRSMLGAWLSMATMDPAVSSARCRVCPPVPQPRSSTAGDGGRPLHRSSARAAHARLPGPCRGSSSNTSKKISQSRSVGSVIAGILVNGKHQVDDPASKGVSEGVMKSAHVISFAR